MNQGHDVGAVSMRGGEFLRYLAVSSIGFACDFGLLVFGVIRLAVNQMAIWFGAAMLVLPYMLAKLFAARACLISNHLVPRAAPV